MRITAILPHLKQFGGVRRFLELAEPMKKRGHVYEIVLPGAEISDAGDCSWFRADVTCHNLKARDHFGHPPLEFDVVLIGDPPSFPLLDHFDCPKYVWVIAGGKFLPQYQAVYGKYPFLVNNRVFLEHFPEARLCEGGVNTGHFRRWPSELTRIGYYKRKGREIEEALNGVERIRLFPLEGINNGDLRLHYRRMDYFVSWEQRPGWSNTAAEALSCGVPVVTNGVNCEPFLDRCIVVDDLREFFANPMGPWSWERVCDRLEEIWREDGIL